MKTEYRFQPLLGFPRPLSPESARKRSPFGLTWTRIQELLFKELRHLNYRYGSVVIGTAHEPYLIRNDGMLRSNAPTPEHPGVVVSFDSLQQGRYQKMVFECDQFTDWKSNVRAIADALGALRKIDRYGVTGGGKENAHYEGFKSLPPAAAQKTKYDYAAVLALYSDGFAVNQVLGDAEARKRAYLLAIAKFHPDKPGGNAEIAGRINEAYQELSSMA